MQLYQKQISPSGRVRYLPHEPETSGMIELDDVQLKTLISTFVIGLLIRAGEQLPDHSRHARELKKLEAAIINYAKASATNLTEDEIDAMVCAWNAAMVAIQQRLG